MRLRQCVFVCKDLESSTEELCDILGIEVAYRDPGVAKWGLANVVCPTGNDFLEIVSPFKDGTSAGRYIERRHGDGGYMVILQVPDAVAERQRVTSLGIRAVAEKDLPEYQYTHFHPSDTSGVLLSIDTTFAPAGIDPALWWPPAEKDWTKHARSDDIIRLDGSQIRFVPIVDGRGPGVSAYDVTVVDRERVLAAAEKRGRRHGVGQVEVCGCRINLV